jgi:glycyl-tRNA synthetase beta chain
MAAKVQRVEAIADRIASQLQSGLPTETTSSGRPSVQSGSWSPRWWASSPNCRGDGGKVRPPQRRTGGGGDRHCRTLFASGAGDQPAPNPGWPGGGLADRLDTLVSIFSLGMLPSGSSDPFALRRAANAIVTITWAANLD